jgi:hypothetical protein
MSTESMQFEDWWEGRGLPENMKAPFYMAWKASRAALVVELPKPPTAQRSDEEATFSAGGCDMLRKCQKALEAAGITVKP